MDSQRKEGSQECKGANCFSGAFMIGSVAGLVSVVALYLLRRHKGNPDYRRLE